MTGLLRYGYDGNRIVLDLQRKHAENGHMNLSQDRKQEEERQADSGRHGFSLVGKAGRA